MTSSVTGDAGPTTRHTPWHLVVMGVSASGKTTVAREMNRTLRWEFAEGDDFHPQANVDKMASGVALTDEDRRPWLRALADWTAEHDAAGRSTIMSCSALRRSYRDVLREGGVGTFFVHLTGDKELLLRRMSHRGGHFMPVELLDSQLATLEPLEPDEPGAAFDVTPPPRLIASSVLRELGLA
ncbi:gluconokinase [Ornithinimicrobium cavernae]|uniref:gluconokinase n=1 Tax=Ornithinimicrobium cavernae TaxID=2666047 RepID=UPI000D6892D3|nr:gluconokinase [Ornithinimicrobium cavernae]